MSIDILRGPQGSNRWSGIGFDGKILQLDDSLAVRGLINYGKGGTEVEFQIDPASFGELAKAMMAIDKNAAVKAFGAALSAGIE